MVAHKPSKEEVGKQLLFDLATAEAEAITKLRKIADPALIETDWRTWYGTIFGQDFVLALAPHHIEAIEWHWNTRLALLAGQSPDYRAYFSIWSRGHLKSTIARRIAVCDAALSMGRGGGYCLYVSGTKGKVQGHSLSIESLISSPQVVKYYPKLGKVKRNRQGQSKGYRQNFIYTDADYVFHFISLDEGIAGANVDDIRPTLICHKIDTLICDDGQWMKVQDHPSVTTYRKERSGINVFLHGVPDCEVVTREHRYWVRRMFRLTDKGRETLAGNYPLQWSDDGWKEAQELDLNCFIGLPIDVTVEQPKSIFTFKRVARQDAASGRLVGSHVVDSSYLPSEFSDPDWWWLFGFWLGDGHVTRTQVGLTVATHDLAVQQRIKALLQKWDKPYSVCNLKTGCFQVVFAHTNFARWLKTWYTTKQKKGQKCPPDWVERLPFEHQREFIKGYVAADGFVDRKGKCVRITSVSLDALRSVRRILARLDVPSSIRNGVGEGTARFDNGSVYQTQKKYDIRFRENVDQFGFDIKPRERYQVTRNFIADGYLWSKIKAVRVSDTEVTFIPIQTKSQTYTTDFGLSHNCPDDIDEREDSPAISHRRFEVFTKGVLPTRQSNTLVFCAQNLVTRFGVVFRINKQRARVLVNRLVTEPIPAVRHLITEPRTVNGIVKDIVVSGVPTWPLYDLKRVQEEIDTIGLPAFMSECQHQVEQQKQGLILPEWDESVHLITWSEFAAIYGIRAIPHHWHKYVGHDWGAIHPCVVSCITTSAENSRLPGLHFLYAGMTFPQNTLADDVAIGIINRLMPTVDTRMMYQLPPAMLASWGSERVTDILNVPREVAAKQIKGQVTTWLANHSEYQRWCMSHEQATIRKNYRDNYGLNFTACNPGATGGIEQLRRFLRVDYSQPHPFRPGAAGLSGMYFIVDDDQLADGKDDKGLALWREQFPEWSWRQMNLTETGLQQDKPIKVHDDAGNCLTADTQVWTAHGHVPIKDVRPGDLVMTRFGWRPVEISACTGRQVPVYKVVMSDGRSLIGTGGHPVWTENRGWIPLRCLCDADVLLSCLNDGLKTQEKSSSFAESSSIGISKVKSHPIGNIFSRIFTRASAAFNRCILRYGRLQMDQFPMTMKSIMSTGTASTMCFPILSVSRSMNTSAFMLRKDRRHQKDWPIWLRFSRYLGCGIHRLKVLSGIGGTLSTVSINTLQRLSNASSVGKRSKPSSRTDVTVPNSAHGAFVTEWIGKKAVCYVGSLLSRLGFGVDTAVTNAKRRIRTGFEIDSASDAVKRFSVVEAPASFVPSAILAIHDAGNADVYNLQVAEHPEFFANGVLVHNSIMMVLHHFSLAAARLSDAEQIEVMLPQGWQAHNAPGTPIDDWRMQGWLMAREMEIARLQKQMAKQYQPQDDPWNAASPLGGFAGGPWEHVELKD